MAANIFKPAGSVEIKNKVKDSKFLGSIRECRSREEAEAFIDKIKAKYEDATHNVSAYVVGKGDRACKYSDDDGEPAGSAGPPVLQAIEGENLINTVVVVTRYFGGTKLGIGGLIRAYGNTARRVIREGGKKEIRKIIKASAAGEYRIIGTIHGQIEAHQGEIISTSYTNKGGTVKFLIETKNFEALQNDLKEKTGDAVKLKKLEESYN